jgi:AraC family transcriptional regulator
MSQPVVPSIEHQTEQWRMKPAAALTGLESTGAAVFRWQRSSTDCYRFERTDPREHVLLSVMLAPMQTRASVDDRQLWSGPIQSGQVRLLQPSQCASWDSDTAFDILHVHLPTQALVAAAQDQGLSFAGFRGTHQPLYQNDKVVHLIARQLALSIGENNRRAREHADLSVQVLIAHLLNNYERSTASPLPHSISSGLMDAFRYIELHPCEKLCIARLAAIAAMSEFHFAREFKRSFGISPHARVLAVRLQRARKALDLPGETVLEIALKCGFVDSSHFARVFRKAYGISPTDFRQSRQNT